jgi:hypothetical protein
MTGDTNAGGHVAAKTWGPFTGRQLTTIICVGIVTVLFPITAWGVTGSSVFLADPHSKAHASINQAGQLSVSPQVAPGASYNAVQLLNQSVQGCSPVTAIVPKGRVLVITSVTVTVTQASLSTGPVEADLWTGIACTQFAAGLSVPGTGQSQTLPLPSGLPIKPGHRLFVNLASPSGNATVIVDTNGFYAPASECTATGPPAGCL